MMPKPPLMRVSAQETGPRLGDIGDPEQHKGCGDPHMRLRDEQKGEPHADDLIEHNGRRIARAVSFDDAVDDQHPGEERRQRRCCSRVEILARKDKEPDRDTQYRPHRNPGRRGQTHNQKPVATNTQGSRS